MIRAWVIAALFLAVLPARAQDAGTPDPTPLTVETRSGKDYAFQVELALTPEQQMRGLMYREAMAPDAGMLFVFPDLRRRSFWMKNTVLPLDIIFVGPDGRILNIAENTTPYSTGSIPSTGPARAVLELNGGVTRLLGIGPGDLVSHPALPAPAG